MFFFSNTLLTPEVIENYIVMDKNIPFGYTYTSTTLTVKLRIKESKFRLYRLDIYPYILGKPGFVIFTAVVQLNTQDHKDLNVKLSKVREDKS